MAASAPCDGHGSENGLTVKRERLDELYHFGVTCIFRKQDHYSLVVYPGSVRRQNFVFVKLAFDAGSKLRFLSAILCVR